MKDNIILEGFMGCGKSSVGIKLSYHLKKTLIDTDKWIEAKYEMSVSEIFEQMGEEAFRKMETQCLEELLESAECQIISLGGGIPMRSENQALLKELGTTIYLKARPEIIYDRVKDNNTRPLLQVEDPVAKIAELMSVREPVYMACADFTVEVSEQTPEQIAQEICVHIK